ncbi:hypothetical protein KC19_2G110800 [Ceratodon purpureus]|uniref:Uncharacterized protein n=1 Tax=Ceratodon purpureus TaxID=3225 RepID=A0A8T0IU87_CERPU|nr:hypothetical protein KC19_2G110800 [Ceratodon purpureus]
MLQLAPDHINRIQRLVTGDKVLNSGLRIRVSSAQHTCFLNHLLTYFLSKVAPVKLPTLMLSREVRFSTLILSISIYGVFHISTSPISHHRVTLHLPLTRIPNVVKKVGLGWPPRVTTMSFVHNVNRKL